MKTCTGCGASKPVSEYSPCRDKLQAKCKRCYADMQSAWRKANPELKARRQSAAKAWIGYYARNKEKEKQRKAAYYQANKPKVRAFIGAYHARNPHVRTAITAQRRAKLLKATPAWADLAAIKAVYRLAALHSEVVEVDHIYPLQGENVCGLHVETNLRVITKSANRSKCNSFPKGME